MTSLRPVLVTGLRVVLGVLATVVGSAMMLLYLRPDLQLTQRWLPLAAAFIPYGVLAWLLATGLLVTTGRRSLRLLALVTTACLAVQLSWTTTYWPHAPASSGPASLTVMTLNTYYGWADSADLADAVAEYRPDVVILQEVTVQTEGLLDSTTWKESFPHQVGQTGEDWWADNTMVFSRFPLTSLDAVWTSESQHLLQMDLPSGPVTLIAAHPTNPSADAARWASELAEIRAEAEARIGEPLLIAGDLNAVAEHAPMRDLMATGLKDAADQAGAGWLPTFPSDQVYPPLISIDHVLVSPSIGVTSATAFPIARTDHHGLVVGLVVG